MIFQMVLPLNYYGQKDHLPGTFEFYTLAAEQGNAMAQYNLGCMYVNGNGVNQSLAKAREWLIKAAAQGQENAINSRFNVVVI